MARFGRSFPIHPLTWQFAKRFFTVVTTKTITGVARIQKSVTQTVTGVGRIQKSATQTETGRSRIQTTGKVRTNLVNNPSFEVNITDFWSGFTTTGSPITSRSTAFSNNGVASFKIDANGVNADAGLSHTYTGIPDGGGTGTFALSGYIKTVGITGDAKIVIRENTGFAALISLTVSAATQDWTRVSGTATLTAGTNFDIIVGLGAYGAPGQGVAYFDGILLERIEAVEQYFDGDTQSAAWTGTAHNSTSTWQRGVLTGHANIFATTTKTETGVTRVQKSATQTETGKARVTATATQTETGKARVTAATTQTETGKARVTASTTKTETGKAAIQNTTTQTETGKAAIQKTTTQTETGTARVQITTTQTETGKANIANAAPTTQTITGKARVTATTTKTETGKAAIQNTTTQTVTGVGRIQKSATQTETGKARVGLVTPQTETGKARVTATTTQTETGKAAIQNTTTQTETGKGRVEKSVTKTETGTARVQISTTQTETGKGRVQQSVAQTETGLARVQKTATQTATGKARVQRTVPQTETGKARVTATQPRTITGHASIDNPWQYSKNDPLYYKASGRISIMLGDNRFPSYGSANRPSPAVGPGQRGLAGFNFDTKELEVWDGTRYYYYQQIKYVAVASNYAILLGDSILGVSTAAARTLTLPNPANVTAGTQIVIKDVTGGANANNITINPFASETIDGAASKVINTNYGTVTLFTNGTNWFTI